MSAMIAVVLEFVASVYEGVYLRRMSPVVGSERFKRWVWSCGDELDLEYLFAAAFR